MLSHKNFYLLAVMVLLSHYHQLLSSCSLMPAFKHRVDWQCEKSLELLPIVVRNLAHLLVGIDELLDL